MDVMIVSLIGIGLLFLLLLSGLEIAVVLGGIGCLGFIFLVDQPLIHATRIWWEVTNSFILTAVPLFIFMGALFVHSGATRSLFDGVNKWLGFLPGGLACSVVGSCALFAAISGSSLATVATIGTISLPEMRKQKYAAKLALGTIAAGGTLGILIPPSITMIIYGEWVGVSIIRLFAAGIIPGIILAMLFSVGIMAVARLFPRLAPKPGKSTWTEKLRSTKGLAPWVATMFVVLGGIFAGIMTPTEAAAVGVVCSLVISTAYRQLSFKVLKRALADTVKLTSMILFLVVGAKVLAFVILSLGIGKHVSIAMLGFAGGSKYAILAIIYLMYLMLGCFLEPLGMMVVTLPFIIPVIHGLGLSSVWFGIPLVIMCEAGFITPPVGLNLFILKGLNPEYGIGEIAIGAAPFLIPMLMVVWLVTIWPQFALWLPGIMMG